MAPSPWRDRTPSNLELTGAPWPVPPLNLFLTGWNGPGTFDLWWDDPASLTGNSPFLVLGVNIYRAFDSEFGTYQRITDLPIGSSYWQDRTDNELVPQENVSSRFILFDVASTGQSGPRYVFRTVYYPMVKEGSQGILANAPDDVRVWVDGVPARVRSVRGAAGEVEIDANTYFDFATQKPIPTVIPKLGSVVTCSYRHSRSSLITDMQERVFYRVTTVGVKGGQDPYQVKQEDLVETPFERAATTSSEEIEKIDYMWAEGVRRNRWILEQGGERVKAFLRKRVGAPCPCIPDDHHHQPISDCPICYGTGVVGGYEGPYDILVAPDDAERRHAQKDMGRTVEHTYEVFTGPSPLVSMRDFLVKINGDRYSIGAVRMPTCRGMVLQQHFNISCFDDKDIRYKVPIGDPVKAALAQFAPTTVEAEALTDITNNPTIPKERQLRGRSLAWLNTTWGGGPLK